MAALAYNLDNAEMLEPKYDQYTGSYYAVEEDRKILVYNLGNHSFSTVHRAAMKLPLILFRCQYFKCRRRRIRTFEYSPRLGDQEYELQRQSLHRHDSVTGEGTARSKIEQDRYNPHCHFRRIHRRRKYVGETLRISSTQRYRPERSSRTRSRVSRTYYVA
jgi:hypothetical protein